MAPSFRAQRNFILQQGLPEPDPKACPIEYSALVFQPRIVSLVLAVAVILQSPIVFFLLGAVLWLGAAAPSLNPFDALYNRTLARSSGLSVSPARPPRRFSQLMAGSFALSIGVCLTLGWRTAAYVLEGMFVVAVLALAFGAFCLGSSIFYMVSGRVAFAMRTLPWAKGD